MRLHFSQKQKQSGLLVYHHDGYTLNLLVLTNVATQQKEEPNPWKPLRSEYNKSLSVMPTKVKSTI